MPDTPRHTLRHFGRLLILTLAWAFASTARVATSAPWSHDAATAIPLAAQSSGVCMLGAVADGQGGARFLAASPCSISTVFTGKQGPYLTLHTGHVRASGDLDAAGVVVLSLAMHSSFSPSFFPDSAGGFYLVWSDERNFAVTGRDLYAHHLLGSGQLDPAWPAQGRLICSAPGVQGVPIGCSDGHRGLFLEWSDRRDSASSSIDCYATHLRADGTLDPAWPANGKLIAGGAGSQPAGTLVPDGTGGVLTAFADPRTPGNANDIFARHLFADGTFDPAWPVNGLPVVVTTSMNEQRPKGVPDGAGGMLLTWATSGFNFERVIHVQAGGTVDPAWPAGGRTLDTPDGMPSFSTTLLADGRGGVFAAYQTSLNSGSSDALVRHILPGGTFDPAWPATPVEVSPAATDRTIWNLNSTDVLAPDGSGGVVVMYDEADPRSLYWYVRKEQHFGSTGVRHPAWPVGGRPIFAPPSVPLGDFRVPSEGGEIVFTSDARDTLNAIAAVYAQHVASDGLLGTDLPHIHAASDVLRDQGGHVMLQWYAPARDTVPSGFVDGYAAWRLLDAPVAAARAIVPPASAASHAWKAGDVRAVADGANLTFWEYLTQLPARGSAAYAFDVATRADSGASGSARETYAIDAHMRDGTFASSPIDSGYSVDNLPPGPPTPFTGTYAGGTSTLHWQRDVEPDVAGYRLYRGPIGFTPAAANLVTALADPDYVDAAGRPYQYAVTAYDVHGNESAPTRLLPTGTLGAGDSPATLAFALASASPANATARFAVALPAAGRVRVRVYDTAGRLVRTLLDGTRPAGATSVTWDLRDERGGRVAAGLFVAVLDAGGERRERRVVVIH